MFSIRADIADNKLASLLIERCALLLCVLYAQKCFLKQGTTVGRKRKESEDSRKETAKSKVCHLRAAYVVIEKIANVIIRKEKLEQQQLNLTKRYVFPVT